MVTMAWAAGWNMAGYSPDPDNVWVTEDWRDAMEYLRDTLDRWWDSEYDVTGDEDGRLEIDGRFLEVDTDICLATAGQEWSGVLVHGDGIPTVLWIVETDAEPDGNL